MAAKATPAVTTVKKSRLPKLSKTGVPEYTLMGASGRYEIQKDQAFIHNPLVQYEMAAKNKITISNVVNWIYF